LEKEMILYTEKQLEEAWILHCAKLIKINARQNIKVDVPTIEEFRPIYEEVLEDVYNEQ
jgi:hypothetical protein